MSNLIWIQTDWHSGYIPERNVRKYFDPEAPPPPQKKKKKKKKKKRQIILIYPACKELMQQLL